MSIAKELPEIVPFFTQYCPFCNRSNRMVVKGIYRKDETSPIEQYPDMGYSFCNCKAIFYTRPENLTDEIKPEPNEEGIITYPDPFFAWPDPYAFNYWDVRRYRIIWPMDSMCEQLKEDGYEVLSAERDFDVQTTTPQHFHIKVKIGKS